MKCTRISDCRENDRLILKAFRRSGLLLLRFLMLPFRELPRCLSLRGLLWSGGYAGLGKRTREYFDVDYHSASSYAKDNKAAIKDQGQCFGEQVCTAPVAIIRSCLT
jgi:hypothetical protein